MRKQPFLGNQMIERRQMWIITFLILTSLDKSVPLSEPPISLARLSLKPHPALKFGNYVSNDPNKLQAASPPP